MQKSIGKEFLNLAERERFLKDNCDAVEQKGYMRPYSPEELQGHKEKLANISIEIAEVEGEMKIVAADFKGRLKPLKETRNKMVENINAKAEYVTENCFRFTDQETRITSYYNAEGDLVESRPATADELQPNLFTVIKREDNELLTGTN